MTTAYFAPSLKSFIQAEWKDDGTYSDETWPADAVLATDEEVAAYWKQTPPSGKLLGVTGGRPAWVDEPAPTHEQIVALADAKKSSLMQIATNKISVLQDAVDYEMATPEETAALTSWKKYRVLLNRIDTSTAPEIDWPIQPEV